MLADFFVDLFDAVCDGETELAREALLMGETLGEGAFGIVVKAEAVGLSHKTEKQFVAVKMLKSEPFKLTYPYLFKILICVTISWFLSYFVTAQALGLCINPVIIRTFIH